MVVVVMRVVVLNRWNSCLDSRHHRRNASMSLTKTRIYYVIVTNSPKVALILSRNTWQLNIWNKRIVVLNDRMVNGSLADLL